ncbi:zinc finger protein RFP-like isoform X2 [Paroedura picta]|uniref:zinc finger protein RFP-like isoform X2 n=1 Tax=Paroedura picta TaxID=143630 RepID=UPI004055DD50
MASPSLGQPSLPPGAIFLSWGWHLSPLCAADARSSLPACEKQPKDGPGGLSPLSSAPAASGLQGGTRPVAARGNETETRSPLLPLPEAAMAAEGLVAELCEEASCSVCLDFFRDPVTIPDCGHNFCRACLDRSWGEPGAQPSCPQCRGRAQPSSLRPNQHLANMVETIQKLRPLEAKATEAKGAEGPGGVCEKHREPLKFFCRDDEAPLCVVCSRSREHRGHQVTPLEEDAAEKKTMAAAGRESVCKKHREPLKLFCRDHEAPLCVVCEQSQEHKYHEIVPAEEASQEYKDQFSTCLAILEKEKEKILEHKAGLVKESQDLLNQTKREWQKTVTKFKQLHTFLDKQEKLLLAQMEEVEMEVAKERDQHLADLSEELSALESLIWEMEERCKQPAGDLLQDARSILQRYEEKESFRNPAAFPPALRWRILDFWDLNPLLEDVKKQVTDILDSGLHMQKGLRKLFLFKWYPIWAQSFRHYQKEQEEQKQQQKEQEEQKQKQQEEQKQKQQEEQKQQQKQQEEQKQKQQEEQKQQQKEQEEQKQKQQEEQKQKQQEEQKQKQQEEQKQQQKEQEEQKQKQQEEQKQKQQEEQKQKQKQQQEQKN